MNMTECLCASEILCLGKRVHGSFWLGHVMEPCTADYFVYILYGSDSVNIDCHLENFILAHIGPVKYIILIKCYKICEVKSNLWP